MLDTDENQDLDLADEEQLSSGKIGKTDAEKFEELTQRGFSPEEIKMMENNAYDGAIDDVASSAEGKEKKDLGDQTGDRDFFNPESFEPTKKEKAGRFMGRNRRKATIGIGLVVLLSGGGFGLFALLAGPLQFIHMAKMLQNFHFSNQEDVSDNRLMKTARYLRFNGDERTRLGYLGNKYANHLESRLGRSGLETQYTRGTFYTSFDGYTIDPDKPNSRLGDLPSDPEKAKLKIAEHFGIDPERVTSGDPDFPNKFKIDANEFKSLESRRLIRAALRDSGSSKVMAAIQSRIMGKRAGIDWRPIKKIDNKLLKGVDDWWAKRIKGIENGAEARPPQTIDAPEETDKEGKPTPESAERTKAAETANNPTAGADGATPVTTEEKIKNVRGKLAKTAGIASIVGMVCLAHSLAQNYDEVKQSNVVLPLMRLGGEGIAVGNQLITGQNVSPEALNRLATKLHGSSVEGEPSTSWLSARSVQAELGKEQTGPDIGTEAKINKDENAISAVLQSLPGLDGVCEALGSTAGRVAMGIVGLFSGPVAFIVGETINETLAPKLINSFMRWLAGHPLDLEVAGANYGNYVNYGAKLAANDSIIAGGGVKLTPIEVAQLKEVQTQTQDEEFAKKSFASRLLDPTDYRSLTGRFISEQAPDPAQNIARVASSAPKALASIFSLPKFFLPKAKAATENYDYGFDTYGYSLADIENDSVKDPFDNADKVYDLLNGPDGDNYVNMSAECFGITISKDGQTVKSNGNVPGYYNIPESCSSPDSGTFPNSSDPKGDWLRMRFYIFDSQTMEAYGCFADGQNGTCSEFGL